MTDSTHRTHSPSPAGEPLTREQAAALFEQAGLFVLGQMDAAERDAFVAQLESGGTASLVALRSALAAIGSLGLTAPQVEPPAGAKERLMARLHTERMRGRAPVAAPASPAESTGAAGQVWRRWRDTTASENPVIPSAEGSFQETGFPGIRVRQLSVDDEARMVTMLIRMDAGSSYPAHRHGASEECYVLSGDLHILEERGEVVMTAGDYQRAELRSVHPVQRTEHGCLLLVRSSQGDELLG